VAVDDCNRRVRGSFNGVIFEASVFVSPALQPSTFLESNFIFHHVYTLHQSYRSFHRLLLTVTMGKSKSKGIPLVPLPKGQVLLPGVVLRISIAHRPDIAALLAHIYSTTTSSNSSSSILIGCMPVGSPYLSPDGKKLIESGGNVDRATPPAGDMNMATLNKGDLFAYGTMAKVTGVQGRVQGELSLVVEGLSRFRVERITKERPYFEATVEQLSDEGEYTNIAEVMELTSE
jgi:ATP-dependent Lon protease